MAKKTDNMIKMIVVYHTADAEMIDTLLRLERIPCVRRKIGAGNILLSMNNFGEEIFVDPEYEQSAREVIEKWREDKTNRREENAEESDPAETSRIEAQKKEEDRKILATRVLAGVVAVALVVFYVLKMR